jgi:catechol 2,3-dioxygenase-like lactoylglutathione lyase family enzyme
MVASLLKEGEAGIVRIVADIRKWQPAIFWAGCRVLDQGIEAMTSQTGRTAGPALVGAEPQLFVADIKAACDFFTQKLGFAIVFVYGEPPFYAQVKRDGARLNLRCVDAPVVDGALRARESLLSASMTVATADEIKQLFLEFQSGGVLFHQTLRAEPWGARDFIVKDPDGNLLLFAGPAE